MANGPRGLLTRDVMSKRVAGLRESLLPGHVKSFKAVKDAQGNIVRDKAGNPVLGKRIKV